MPGWRQAHQTPTPLHGAWVQCLPANLNPRILRIGILALQDKEEVNKQQADYYTDDDEEQQNDISRIVSQHIIDNSID